MADVAYDRGWTVRWQLERPTSPCKQKCDAPQRLSHKGRGASHFWLHGRTPGSCASCAPCQRLVRRGRVASSERTQPPDHIGRAESDMGNNKRGSGIGCWNREAEEPQHHMRRI